MKRIIQFLTQRFRSAPTFWGCSDRRSNPLFQVFFSFAPKVVFPSFFLIHVYKFLVSSWPFSNSSSRTFGADTALTVFHQAQHATQWCQAECQIWTGFGYFGSSHENFRWWQLYVHSHPQWLSLKLAFVVWKTIALYTEEKNISPFSPVQLTPAYTLFFLPQKKGKKQALLIAVFFLIFIVICVHYITQFWLKKNFNIST